MSWQQPRNVVIPWMKTLSDTLPKVELPAFRGQQLWVLSDYCFDDPTSDFDVIGLLITDPVFLGKWNAWRSGVRWQFLDERRMKWNRLNSDSRRWDAFLPFLAAANQIYGLSIVVAFYRHSAFRFPPAWLRDYRDTKQLCPNWKAKHLEHMFRIAYCTAFFIASLSSPGQSVHWVSDHDAIFANDDIEKDTIGVFTTFLNMFLPHRLSEIRYNTSEIRQPDMLQEDLAAIPDLMCGAACDILTAIKKEHGDFPEGYSKLPEFEERCRHFLNWYAGGNQPLKRYICAFAPRAGRVPRLSILPPDLMGYGVPANLD